MSRLRIALLFTIALSTAVLADNQRNLRANMSGYQEVPTLSSSGTASFEARIDNGEAAVDWQLSYAGTESTVTQSHIHLGATATNGPVIVFLCSNLGNGPAGTQPCPAAPATISGTFTAADVTAGGAGVGLEANNLAELIAAIRAGATYANLHTTGRPGGEVRGQIDSHDARHTH